MAVGAVFTFLLRQRPAARNWSGPGFQRKSLMPRSSAHGNRIQAPVIQNSLSWRGISGNFKPGPPRRTSLRAVMKINTVMPENLRYLIDNFDDESCRRIDGNSEKILATNTIRRAWLFRKCGSSFGIRPILAAYRTCNPSAITTRTKQLPSFARNPTRIMGDFPSSRSFGTNPREVRGQQAHENLAYEGQARHGCLLLHGALV